VSFFGQRGVFVDVYTHMGDMIALPVRLDGDCPLGWGEIVSLRRLDRAMTIPFGDMTSGPPTRRVKA